MRGHGSRGGGNDDRGPMKRRAEGPPDFGGPRGGPGWGGRGGHAPGGGMTERPPMPHGGPPGGNMGPGPMGAPPMPPFGRGSMMPPV
jgi:hypothetical protein